MRSGLNRVVTGIATQIGDVLAMEEWAEQHPIPDRKRGGYLSGEEISRIVGIHGKSWHRELFSEPQTMVRVAREALESADCDAGEIDCLIVSTCTPFEIKLSQDSFRLARELGLRDDALHFQIEAGCGGLARVMAMARGMAADKILVVAYNGISPLTERSWEQYTRNLHHPEADRTWFVPAIFSDGAGAMVLERCHDRAGFVFYSRDQLCFGDEPGFPDPIVSHLGGGNLHPVDAETGADYSVFLMQGHLAARYYNKGMVLNYRRIQAEHGDFLERARKIYIHQAGPSLVRDFYELTGVDRRDAPTNCRQLGNMVSPCTVHLLHDDLLERRVARDDAAVFCLVGAGPERGAFGVPLAIRKVVPMRVGHEQKEMRAARLGQAA